MSRDKKLKIRKHKKTIHYDISDFGKYLKVEKEATEEDEEEEVAKESSPLQISPTLPEPPNVDSFDYAPKSPDSDSPMKTSENITLDLQATKSIPQEQKLKEPHKPESKSPAVSNKEAITGREKIVYDLDNRKSTARNEKKKPQKMPQVKYPWINDTKATNIMKNWYPLRFKLAYPKKSVLNPLEQKDFISFHSRFRNRTHLNEKEVKHYKTYAVSEVFGQWGNYKRI